MQGLPNIGEVVDEVYEIQHMLGKGGFGAVYLARHLPMQRDVALKLLLAHGPDPAEMVERFKREVMAIRVLSHPNTVRIFDFRDSSDSMHLYYTMEYLKGETFKDIIRREGAQPPRRVKNLLRQILKSLAEAHSYGIVHRDLKPANLMVVEMHGEQDFVKVLDFGIAKIMEQEDDEDEPLTSAGMLVGTLRYMSPEQIKGFPLGPYTDLYSLGLIALELLAGKSVFAGTGRWEIMQRQVSPEPIGIPEPLQGSPLALVFGRALAKEPDERYASAEQMLRDLDSIPDGALSATPLILNAAAEPYQLSNSSSSHLSKSSGLRTPPPTPFDQARTQISEVEAYAEREAVAVSAASGAQHLPIVDAPMQPLPDTSHPSTPAPIGTASAPLAASSTPPMGMRTFDEDRRRETRLYDENAHGEQGAEKRKGAPKILLIGVPALLFLLGAVAIAASALSENEDEAPARTVVTKRVTDDATVDAVVAAAASETTPEIDPDDIVIDEPAPPEEPPAAPATRMILVKVENRGVEAMIFDGDEELGTTPKMIELTEGEPRTLRLEARGHEDVEQQLDDDSDVEIGVTLRATPRPNTHRTRPDRRDDRQDGSTIDLVEEDKGGEDDGWASIPVPKDTKPKPKPKPKEKPKIPIF